MKANDKRDSTTDSPSQSAPLKDSDFFPPGAGWNGGNGSDESAQPASTDERSDEQRKH